MNCTIYKGNKRPDTYLYLEQEDVFTPVPESLLALLGTSEKVMQITLSREKKLAQADTEQVMQQLADLGYYLQMPPSDNKFQS